MASSQSYDFFVERISNVSHANGVFRITLGVNDSPNEVRPVTRLIIPANQLGPMLQGIANAAKNIGEQIQPRLNVDLNEKEIGTGKKKSGKAIAPRRKSADASRSKKK